MFRQLLEVYDALFASYWFWAWWLLLGGREARLQWEGAEDDDDFQMVRELIPGVLAVALVGIVMFWPVVLSIRWGVTLGNWLRPKIRKTK